MNRNRLGQSGLTVGEIGLGCMSLAPDSRDSERIIHQALDSGVEFFDTADLYQQGENEALLGRALRGRRAQAVIATKVGNRWEPGKSGWTWAPTGTYIERAVRDSLRRLQTDYIDLYQLHGGTLEDPIDDIVAAFEKLKAAGTIRAYGISSIRPNVIREFAERSSIQTVMTQYSILDRRPEEFTLGFLHGRRISAVARGPLAQGLLSGRAVEKVKESGYLGHDQKEVLNAARQLEELAAPGRPPTWIAIRYALAHPAVAVALVGARTPEQLRVNLQAAETPALTEDEMAAIRSFAKARVYEQHR